MNVKKLLLATLVVGVVANVLDFIVHGLILQGAFYSKLTALFRTGMPMGWFIFGDFVVALVLLWVYDRVYGSLQEDSREGHVWTVRRHLGEFSNLAFRQRDVRRLPLRVGLDLDRLGSPLDGDPRRGGWGAI